jgi:acyl-homoserine lactone acylase PvdQ
MMNKYLGLLFLIAGISLGGLTCESAQPDIYPDTGQVRIVTDGYGVPHIFASTLNDANYGLGYCHALNRIKQLYSSKLTALGRISEIKGAKYLEQDYTYRLFELKGRAEQILSELETKYIESINAYCQGVNDYIRSNRARIPDWIIRYEPVDLVAFSLMANLYFPRQRLMVDKNKLPEGSNQFAVSKDRSRNGYAMMAFDSHMRFSGPFVWMEVHLSTPDLSVMGCTIPGLPYIIMGHNGHVAWSSTRNGPDLTDIYAFKIHPQNRNKYRGPEGWMDFRLGDHAFKYISGQGMKEKKRTLRYSHIGPVLKVVGNVAYVGRVAGFDSERLFEQMHIKSRAKTVGEYLQAFRIPGLNMWNIMAVDTKGNIGYLSNAILPIRNPGLDWSRPVRGEDSRTHWKGIVPFEKLPLVINPASGWLQNCNDPPWHVTFGNVIKKEEVPFRLASGGLGSRGRRISELLSSNKSVNLNDMINYSKDTLIPGASLWVTRLISAYEKYNGDRFPKDTDLEDAIQLLKSWDFCCDAKSRCTALYYYWYRKAKVHRILNDSQITQKVLKTQLKNFDLAAKLVKKRYGRLDVPWGEILFLDHGEREFPVSGGSNLFSVVKCAYGVMNSVHKIPVTIGSSYMMVVEMSPIPKAYSCFPLGINENPGNKHFADMSLLYSKMQYKPVYFTWKELEPNIESNIIIETKINK